MSDPGSAASMQMYYLIQTTPALGIFYSVVQRRYGARYQRGTTSKYLRCLFFPQTNK